MTMAQGMPSRLLALLAHCAVLASSKIASLHNPTSHFAEVFTGLLQHVLSATIDLPVNLPTQLS